MKKGMTSMLVSIIFVIIAMVVLLFPYKLLYGSVENDRGNIECKISIAKAISSDNPFALDCPMADVVITRADVESDKAKRVVAERMKKCWENFGGGTLRPYDTNIFTRGEIVCQKCSMIFFDEDVQLGKIEGMRAYLRQNKMLMSEGFYSDYLYDKFGGEFDDLVQDDLSTTDTYFVVYQTYNPALVEVPLLSKFNQVDSALFLVSEENYPGLRCKHEFD